MLAATLEDLNDVKFPVYVSPKLDGIRCLILNGQAVSRNLKPIPNRYIQERLKGLPNGLDGELMIKNADFNQIQSFVMSEFGECDIFCYHIFDLVEESTYVNRLNILTSIVHKNCIEKPICQVSSWLCAEREHIESFEQEFLTLGYEGIMLRSPESPYKHGRSTIKEQYLMKYKRFKDQEGFVIGFEEQLHNDNEAETDLLGHTVRSSKKIGMIPAAMLGSLILYDEKLDKEFNVGSGFTKEQRIEIWKNQKKYMGQMVTYTYQELSAKGVPRFPVFKNFRYDK